MAQDSIEKSNKIQLSLAAIMFFAPFVHSMLRSNQQSELSTQDKDFVESYVQYGYATLTVVVLAIIMTIRYFFQSSEVLYRLHTSLSIIVIIMLIGGIIAVFSDIQILKLRNIQSRQDIQTDSNTIMLNYIPIYNIYLRYKAHQFTKPMRRNKESILLRTVFVITTVIRPNGVIGIVILVFIILRVASLLGGVDILDEDFKVKGQKSFGVNPEELRSYVIASITRLYHKLIKPNTALLRSTQQQKYQKIYQQLYPMSNKNIQRQYAVGIVLLGRRLRQYNNASISRLAYFTAILILGRYVIAARYRKHLPELPIVRELGQIVQYLYKQAHRVLKRKSQPGV